MFVFRNVFMTEQLHHCQSTRAVIMMMMMIESNACDLSLFNGLLMFDMQTNGGHTTVCLTHVSFSVQLHLWCTFRHNHRFCYYLIWRPAVKEFRAYCYGLIQLLKWWSTTIC